ncbi:CinA family protein [Boseongicola sp. H5]|uniref:CinA family protein n=1 Tax=Boseongicola sp. H5 TaxID=2763261 RepID=UPI001D0B6CEC|nr:CinA family protein [Boseongicola sp. H5]
MTARAVIDALRARGWMLATAESCTGGLIAGAITDIAGSSDVFDRGFVTYSNAAKIEMLGVEAQTLERFGAVSEEVARQMAQGALARSAADIAISVTGIAGPGGSGQKPEGRVCFGLATRGALVAETVDYGAPGRAEVRAASVAHVLAMVLRAATGDQARP